jgi:hypothetical protein
MYTFHLHVLKKSDHETLESTDLEKNLEDGEIAQEASGPRYVESLEA